MKLPLLSFLVLTIHLSAINDVDALTLPPVPLEPIYFEPPILEASEDNTALDCVALDRAIRYLYPYRYSYKPKFYEDDANKIATTLVMVDIVPIVKGLVGVGYLGYSALVEEKEQRRVLLIEQQISLYQQIKAEKHCFE